MFKLSTRHQALAGAVLLWAAQQAGAATITIDGNLSDIVGVVGTTNALNYGYGSDPMGSAEGTESNNGFDIKNVYAYFNVNLDTLYLGLSVYGTVGDSQPLGSGASNEGIAVNGPGSNSRTNFDANETYGIQLYWGTSTSDPQLLQYNVKGGNLSASDTVVSTNPYSLTINHAVSESFNGVEWSITGLLANGALIPSPQDLLVRFSAGSSDTSGTTTLGEDVHLLQMSAVPVPAAVWLMASGFLGLVAAARRRK